MFLKNYLSVYLHGNCAMAHSHGTLSSYCTLRPDIKNLFDYILYLHDQMLDFLKMSLFRSIFHINK